MSHPESVRDYDRRQYAGRAARRVRLRRELQLWKEAQGCCWCGVREGRLHHHHVDPTTKRYDVSLMVDFDLEELMDEIAKCVVLCHPCHNRYHRMLAECGS